MTGAATLVIRSGKILDPRTMSVDGADILIIGNRIAAMGRLATVQPGAQELDAAGCIVLPGLINAHMHAHNNLSKSIADAWTLEELRNRAGAIYSQRSAEDLYLSAAVGAIEMAKWGCTAAYDQFAAVPMTLDHIEAVIRAYLDVGMRAVVAPLVFDSSFYETIPGLLSSLPAPLRASLQHLPAPPGSELLRLCEEAIRSWDGLGDGRIRLAVAPLAPGDCSDDLLVRCRDLVQNYGVSVHTHLAETKVQAVAALKRDGRTLVTRLLDLGMLGPRLVAGHSVWVTDEDIMMMADAGATVAHNPASNLKLGSGIAPATEMLAAGLTVGLGSDGTMSSDNLNMFEAMRFAALVSRVRFPYEPESWIDARAAWQMATVGSAAVLGMEDEIGVLAIGRKADLVLLREDSPLLRPTTNILNSLVFSETGADVSTVVIDGRLVVHDGRVLNVDEAEILRRAQAASERSRGDLPKRAALADQLAPYVANACKMVVASEFPVDRYSKVPSSRAAN